MAWTGDQIIKFSKSDKDFGTDNRLSQTDKRLSVADNIIEYIMGGRGHFQCKKIIADFSVPI